MYLANSNNWGHSSDRIGIGNNSFRGDEKTGVPEGKPLGARTLSPTVTSVL